MKRGKAVEKEKEEEKEEVWTLITYMYRIRYPGMIYQGFTAVAVADAV